MCPCVSEPMRASDGAARVASGGDSDDDDHLDGDGLPAIKTPTDLTKISLILIHHPKHFWKIRCLLLNICTTVQVLSDDGLSTHLHHSSSTFTMDALLIYITVQVLSRWTLYVFEEFPFARASSCESSTTELLEDVLALLSLQDGAVAFFVAFEPPTHQTDC